MVSSLAGTIKSLALELIASAFLTNAGSDLMSWNIFHVPPSVKLCMTHRNVYIILIPRIGMFLSGLYLKPVFML